MPHDLARKVRVLAAKADTSMSQFLCKLVAEKVQAENAYEKAMKSYLARRSYPLRTAGEPLPKREELYDRHALR